MFEKLSQSLELTQQILSAAKQGEWHEVERLQLSREHLTTQTESLPLPEDSVVVQMIGQLITDIQNIDAQITPLLEKQRRALMEEKLQSNKGRRMAKAYQASK